MVLRVSLRVSLQGNKLLIYVQGGRFVSVESYKVTIWMKTPFR